MKEYQDMSNGELRAAIQELIREKHLPQDDVNRISLAVDNDILRRIQKIEENQKRYKSISYYWEHHRIPLVLAFLGISLVYISDSREFILQVIASVIRMLF